MVIAVTFQEDVWLCQLTSAKLRLDWDDDIASSPFASYGIYDDVRAPRPWSHARQRAEKLHI